MTENRKEKAAEVRRISKLLKDSSGMLLFEYHGLNVANISEIRNIVKNQDAKMNVLKNRLVKIATKKAGHEALEEFLIGPNVFVFINEEHGLNTIKSVVEFAKQHKVIKLKAAIYEDKVINAEELKLVATLPTYEEALTILARSLLTPLQQVGVGLKMLVDENHIKSE